MSPSSSPLPFMAGNQLPAPFLPGSLISPKARTVTQRTRQTSDNNVVHFRTIPPFPLRTHTHTQRHAHAHTGPAPSCPQMLPLPTREQQQQRCVAGSYIFLIYFSSSSPNSGLPTSPSRQPTTPLHCTPTLRPAANPNPKCRKACFIFCAFFISETPTSRPNTLRPTPASD